MDQHVKQLGDKTYTFTFKGSEEPNEILFKASKAGKSEIALHFHLDLEDCEALSAMFAQAAMDLRGAK